MHSIKLLVLIATMGCSAAAFSAPNLEALRKEGERDGKRYAQDSKKNGIKVDGTTCAVGIAAEDQSRPELSQEQIEAYAKAFGNACVGRNIF